MTHPGLLPSAAASIALLIAIAAYPLRALGENARPLPLTIVFTGDVAGYLEPCG